ncbi:hypothetical protein HanIR_Chr12g0609551 [Helianthus annuus]|nr:hypothetical protein HanIR_Chr12g0609551 [Helianthus annuus]
MHVQNHRRQQFLQNRTAATPLVFLNSCKKMLARVFDLFGGLRQKRKIKVDRSKRQEIRRQTLKHHGQRPYFRFLEKRTLSRCHRRLATEP